MSIEVDPDWWKTLFDQVYLLTDARSVGNDAITRREIDVCCALLTLRPGDRTLDLCGGHGRHSMELCRRGWVHCTVLDYSQPLLDIGMRHAAAKNYPIQFAQGDAREMAFTDNAFDHVLILGNSLGYIPDDHADLSIFHESYRVLRPGGWLLIDVTDGVLVRQTFTPNAWHEIDTDVVVCRQRELHENMICAREMVLNKNSGMVRDRSYCIRLYSADRLAGLVEAAGFASVQIHKDFSPYDKAGDMGFMNHRMIVIGCKI